MSCEGWPSNSNHEPNTTSVVFLSRVIKTLSRRQSNLSIVQGHLYLHSTTRGKGPV